MPPRRTVTTANMHTSAVRITTLRQKAGLTQGQVAAILGELTDKNKGYGISTVSSWERGARPIPLKAAVALAELYAVNVDYIRGIADEKSDIPEKNEINIKYHNNVLSYNQLLHMDGEPVYVCFPNKEHQSCWGIVDVCSQELVYIYHKKHRFICEDPMPFHAFAMESDYINTNILCAKHRLGISQITTSTTPMWVSLICADVETQAAYNGWYHYQKPTKGSLESYLMDSLGHILPLSGLNRTYVVYSEKP